MEIANNCLFYNLTLYYSVRDVAYPGKIVFYDYTKFYNDNSYKNLLIEEFYNKFLSKTINIILENTGKENITNWMRSQKAENIFLSKLNAINTTDLEYLKNVKQFFANYNSAK